jgi:hypothetical protein
MNVKRYWNKPSGIPENNVDLLRKFCRGTRHLVNITSTSWPLAAFPSAIGPYRSPRVFAPLKVASR